MGSTSSTERLAIAGITLGCIAFVLVVVLLILWFTGNRHHHHHRSEKDRSLRLTSAGAMATPAGITASDSKSYTRV